MCHRNAKISLDCHKGSPGWCVLHSLARSAGALGAALRPGLVAGSGTAFVALRS